MTEDRGRFPTLKAVVVIRALRRAGFEVVGQESSHVKLRHPDGRITIVPDHRGQDIGRGMLRRIIRDAGIERDEFLALLRRR